MNNQEPQENNKISTPKSTRKINWRRILKIVAFPIGCLFALIIGLYIGYVRIGGQQLGDIFSWSTWQHLLDLMFAK